MPFKMVCPKCGTTAFHIERERRYYSKADPVASLIMSCQCGKRLYGKDVEDEYKSQKKAYESSNQELQQEESRREHLAQVERKRRQQMRAAMAYRAEFEAKRKPKSEGQDEDSGPVPAKPILTPAPSSKGKTAKGVSPHPAILPSTMSTGIEAPADNSQVDEEDFCAWHNCTRGPNGGRAIRRKNSKYCSRACSNANARWRFKQRKKDEDA